MAKIHVLTGDGAAYTLVIHIPIPVGVNAGGRSWYACLVNSGLGGATQLKTGTGPGQISTAELAQIQAGEVYETTTTINVQGIVAADMGGAVDALVAQISAEALTALEKALNWFGVTRD